MEDVHAAVAAQLAQVSQRYTEQRRALVAVLAEAGRPLGITEVRDASRLPQSSVYRNLAVLEQAGAVHRVHTAGDAVHYELAEEHTEHHHHLVCSVCGTVTDYSMSETLERSMAKAAAEVAAQTGFRAAHHRVDLFGVCADCT
ncbi:MAG: Fur family transcriptional regulator [Acidimicrobiia bacterium]